ncbi:MAG TPA: VWA domain-containing protein [Candidatus Krumholzibacteriaceae bacterium]|nr:VWA domain-containing protein [Candidatus Krumholzibacteriaceae bacterium]
MHIGNVKMLSFLWLAVLPVFFYLWARYRRKRALRLFIEADLLGKIGMTVIPSRRVWKMLLVVLSVALIVFSLSRPAWNPKPQKVERRGRDIVFVLDVSKSMLAEDLAPNRLRRAKFAIEDMIKSLKGDRVALVVFSGSAVLKCPLTLDYGFFRLMLERVDVNSVSRGGTMIGDAVRKALEDGFDDQEKKYKDILLITDGEDHDSFPVQAAQEASQHGVRIIAIGLGDENQGKRIPVTDEDGRKTFLKYKGREVWSRLDATTLRKMANATDGGKYLNVATGNIDLGMVYRKLISGEEKRKIESKTIKLYEEKFQIFIALAIALLIVEMFIAERRRVRE